MNTDLSAIKTSIQEGDLEGAGQALLAFAHSNSSRFYNEVLAHVASLKQIMVDERRGVVSSEATKINKNRVIFALLDIIDEIDREVGGKSSTSPESLKGKKNNIVFESPVGQVIIQKSHAGDNVVEKKEKVIKIGKNANISAPIVIADSLENSFNALAKSKVDDEIKLLLGQLLTSVNDVNKTIDAGQALTAEMMARDAEKLVSEVVSEKPRRKWYEVSIEGLKQAAENIGEVATPIIGLLKKLAPLLLP